MIENYRRTYIHSTNIYWAHCVPSNTFSTRNAGMKDSLPVLGNFTLEWEKQANKQATILKCNQR